MKEKEIVYYTLAGHDEVLESPRWCLEGQIQEDKFRLGLSPYAEYKELKDYAPPSPHPELAAYISDVCNPNKPEFVHKTPRKRKSKPQTSKLSTVLNVLDDTVPSNLVPESLRDRMAGSTNTVPNGMDQ
jgi:hypothetical protein